MGVLLVLNEVELTADPGGEVTLELQLRNTGAVVDQFTLELVGDATEWAEITPKIVNLFPDSESTAQLVFKPPKSSDVLAGEVPFAVRALSREDPEGSVVEEGTVTVQPFTEITAEIVPHGSRGAFRGRHKLAVDNRSNIPVPVDVRLLDAKNELDLKIRPASQVLVPGTATLFPLKAIPKKRFLRGTQKTLPFQALVTGEGFEPVTADAAMVQEQILPKWLPKTLAALFALAVTLGILWVTVLKPVLKTEAQNAAQQQTSNLTAGVSAAQSQAAAANSQAAKANTSVNDTNKQLEAKGLITPPPGAPKPTSGSVPTPTPTNAGTGPQPGANPQPSTNPQTGPTPAPGGGPTSNPSPATNQASVALQGDAPPNSSGQYTYFTTDPQSAPWVISDVLISNAAGDQGFVQLQINHGGQVTNFTPVLTLNLADFVTQDEHFVQPIAVHPGDTVSFGVDCTNTAKSCRPLAYLSTGVQ
ncbi:COG1470 family protein [Streptacidiphilus rugosus]|uniref:COG1470 family protein n=1 Tax=Streptacidiphilus rugosus TaxID=405783 RepID=UPI00056275F4|nr:hypothetical protein [Streptacidiphilus rugosus]